MLFLGFAVVELALCGIGLLLMLIFLARDTKLYAVLLGAATAGILIYKNLDGFQAYFAESGNIWGAVKIAGLWIVAGFIFSFGKWYLVARKVARKLKQYLKDHLGQSRGFARGGETNDMAYCLQTFNAHYNDKRGLFTIVQDSTGSIDTDYNTLKMTEYVTAWTIFWPLYAMLIVCEDLLTELFDQFVKCFGTVFKKLGRSAFSDVN